MTEKQYNYISNLYNGVTTLGDYIIKFWQENTKKKLLTLPNYIAQQFIKCGQLHRRWAKAHDSVIFAEIRDPYESPERIDALDNERYVWKEYQKEEKQLLKLLKNTKVLEDTEEDNYDSSYNQIDYQDEEDPESMF